jgi:quercetin dioxygenase-like cupin family protein
VKRQAMILAVLGVCLATAAVFVRTVLATPASGFVGTTLAVGRFGSIDVMNHQILESAMGRKKNVWLSWQKTKGASDLYVQNNVWDPGGSTGWHTHPGHSLIIVTAGTVTAYEGDDPSCTPHVYTVGQGFVDPGGDHVHLLRNEDSVEARTMAVQLVPAGATRRIDAPAPAACPL